MMIFGSEKSLTGLKLEGRYHVIVCVCVCVCVCMWVGVNVYASEYLYKLT